MSRFERPARILLLLTLAGLVAFLMHWRLFENDVFWQIRAGDEIIRTHHIQTRDHWTSTAYGSPWFNFQWLSCVVFRLVDSLRHDFWFLPTLRSLMVGLSSFLILVWVHRMVPVRLSLIVLTATFLLCSIVISGRLQLRPDLFGFLCFAGLLNLLCTRLNPNLLALFCCLICCLWTQFHAGTAPVGIFLFSVHLFSGHTFSGLGTLKRGFWFFAGILTLFMGPIGWHSLEMIYRITVAYDPGVINNPDHWAMSPGLLLSSFAWPLTLWALLTLSSLLIALHPQLSSAVSRNRRPAFLTLLIMAIGTLFKMRLRLYSMPLALPFLVAGLQALTLHRSVRSGVRSAFLIALLSGSGFLTWKHFSTSPDLGFGIQPDRYPVHTAQWIHRWKPSPLLFNAYDFGGYVANSLREYQHSQDGREVIFEGFFRQLAAAQDRPSALSALMDKFGFNTLIVKSPTDYLNLPVNDSYEEWYPSSQWAQVAFDDASIVYIRRIPEHARLIADHGYSFFKRTLHPIRWAFDTQLSAEQRQQTHNEIRRCLNLQPNNQFCLLGLWAYARTSGDTKTAQELESRITLPRSIP